MGGSMSEIFNPGPPDRLRIKLIRLIRVHPTGLIRVHPTDYGLVNPGPPDRLRIKQGSQPC